MKSKFLAAILLSFFTLAHAESVEIGSPAFEEAIRNYLLQNPEVIFEAVDIYNANQQEAALKAVKTAIQQNQDQLYNEEFAIVQGNPEADFAIVEFIDYNCGYCRKSHEEMNQVIEAHPDVKLLIKQFPILSQGSLDASRIVMALIEQGENEAALALHNYLYEDANGADLETALAFVETQGISRAEIEKAVESQAIYDELAASNTLAEALQIDGTPGFVLGDEVVRGYVPADQLDAIIANIKG